MLNELRFPAGGRLKRTMTAVSIAAGAALLAWGASRFIRYSFEPADPMAIQESERDPRQLAAQLSASRIFGSAETQDAAGAASTGTGDDLRLVGVAAGSDMALIAAGGQRALWFHVGSDVAPGVRLTEVLARQVKLERLGRTETLMLPEEKWKK